jgi:cytidylate kinase
VLAFQVKLAYNYLLMTEKLHNEVWTISGKKAVGKTTVCKLLETWAERESVPLEYYNPGKIISEEYEMVTGKPLTGFNVRPQTLNLRHDSEMAEHMVSPDNAGKIVVIDSRLGGYTARELEMAAKKTGTSEHLPVAFHSVLIFADDQVRRGTLEKAGIETSLEAYDSEEEKNFARYKSEAGIRDLFAPLLLDEEGKPVYTYRYDTGSADLLEIARDIWKKMKEQSMPNLV